MVSLLKFWSGKQLLPDTIEGYCSSEYSRNLSRNERLTELPECPSGLGDSVVVSLVWNWSLSVMSRDEWYLCILSWSPFQRRAVVVALPKFLFTHGSTSFCDCCISFLILIKKLMHEGKKIILLTLMYNE